MKLTEAEVFMFELVLPSKRAHIPFIMLYLCRWRGCIHGASELDDTVGRWPKYHQRVYSMCFSIERVWIIGDPMAAGDRLWHTIDVTGGMSSQTGCVKDVLRDRYDYIKRIPKRDIDRGPMPLSSRVRLIPYP